MKKVINTVRINYGQMQKLQSQKIDITRKILAFAELNFDRIQSSTVDSDSGGSAGAAAVQRSKSSPTKKRERK